MGIFKEAYHDFLEKNKARILSQRKACSSYEDTLQLEKDLFDERTKLIDRLFYDKKIKKSDVEEILLFEDNRAKFMRFNHLVMFRVLSAPAFNCGLKEAYTMSYGDLDMWLYWFSCSSPRLLMNKTELEKYKSLPDVVTLYRGTDEQTIEEYCYGLSWTDRREIAEFFAFRGDRKGVVIKANVSRKSVFAYFDSREESEYIIDYDCGLSDVEIIATEPTEFYFDYMKRKENSLK